MGNKKILFKTIFTNAVLGVLIIGVLPSFQAKASLQCQALFKNQSVAAAEFNLRNETHLRKIKEDNMLPLGSALITSSGNLRQSGIERIVHAASGSMNKSGVGYDPTLKSIADSLENSLKLAEQSKLKSVAVPFIGGGIFASRIGVTNAEIAEVLLKTVASVQSYTNIQVKFVLFGQNDFNLFKNIADSLQITKIEILEGSIANFQLHLCPVIVNAANSEVKFGGGLSGLIGNSDEINAEAQSVIKNYWNLF